MKEKSKATSKKTKRIVDKLIIIDGVLEGVIFDMTDPTETEGIYECDNPFIRVNFTIEKKQKGVYIGKQTSIITSQKVINPKALRIQLLGVLAIPPLN